MLCDICHKNIATVHLTEIVNDKIIELHICQTCAKHKTEELKQQLSISEFLSSLVTEPDTEKRDSTFKCNLCGTSLFDFKKKGRLGCARCYITFKIKLIQLLKKIHGFTHHKGKFPRVVEEGVVFDRKLRVLKERLERAIQLEEYEEAVCLRDEIRKLEKEIKAE